MKNECADGIYLQEERFVEGNGLMKKAMNTFGKKSGLLLKATREALSARYLSDRNEQVFENTGVGSVLDDISCQNADGKIIVERNGLFFVSESFDDSSIEKNQQFLELVESVMN